MTYLGYLQQLITNPEPPRNRRLSDVNAMLRPIYAYRRPATGREPKQYPAIRDPGHQRDRSFPGVCTRLGQNELGVVPHPARDRSRHTRVALGIGMTVNRQEHRLPLRLGEELQRVEAA